MCRVGKPRSATISSSRCLLRRPVLYPTELRARVVVTHSVVGPSSIPCSRGQGAIAPSHPSLPRSLSDPFQQLSGFLLELAILRCPLVVHSGVKYALQVHASFVGSSL